MSMCTLKASESPYEWATNRDGYRVLLRNKHPRIVVEVPDGTDDKQLADALRKAAEFVLKGERAVKPKTEERCVVRRNGKLLALETGKLILADNGNIIGDICDDECGSDCMHFCNGTCPFGYMTMTDGERVRVWDLNK